MGVFDSSKNIDPQFNKLMDLQSDQRYQFIKGRMTLEQIEWFNNLSLEAREELMNPKPKPLPSEEVRLKFDEHNVAPHHR